MKAYYLFSINEEEPGGYPVFAKNSREAKKKLNTTNLYLENYTNLRVRRLPQLDDKENLSEFERDKLLWRQRGWGFDEEDLPPDPDETTDEEFKKWYEENVQMLGWSK